MKLLGHHVNTAALIHEVGQHPAIWNTALEEYEDIVERRNAWLAVLMKFIPQFNDKPLAEIDETVAVIRKKWKAMRSCYARELQKKRKENSGLGARGRKRRQYVYFEHLSFLGTVSNQTTFRMNEEVETDASLENEEKYEMGLEMQKEDKKAEKLNYNQLTKKTHEDDAFILALENTEDLIHEVEKHPVIWNTAMKENKNKLERRYAWRAAILKFVPEFDEKPLAERTKIMTVFRKKWTGIRSCYAREIQKREEDSGSGSYGRTQYVHFEDLSFLGTLSKQTTSRMDEEVALNDNLTIEIAGGEVLSIEMEKENQEAEKQNCKQSTKRKTDDDELIQILKKKMLRDENSSGENDEDRLFLLSLTSELHKVPADRKLQLKSDIICAISQAQQCLR